MTNRGLKWATGILVAVGAVPSWGLDGFGSIGLESYEYESTGQRVAIPNAGAAVVDPGFDIVLNYTVAPTASQAAAFSAAEAFWESTILGYQENVGGANTLPIKVELPPIAPGGGTLGQAGPTSGVITSNFLYATDGDMQFDSADLAGLESAGTFNEVILHEMGHVIGIGTLWSVSDATGGGVTTAQEVYVNNSGEYTGAAGVAAYNLEFAQAASVVPVELGGGPGTANGHWNEVDNGAGPTGLISIFSGQDLQFELMTGWLNAPTFTSQLTIQSLRDIGYEVVPIPEPTTVGMLLGLLSLASMRRRRNA